MSGDKAISTAHVLDLENRCVLIHDSPLNQRSSFKSIKGVVEYGY